jgi:phosphate uptake regulator
MTTDILKEYVKKLIEYETQEEHYKNIMNNIKKEKEKINDSLMNLLVENNITDKDIIFGDKKIKYTSQKITENITKKLILERLTSYLKDENVALQATNYIYSERNASVKNYIKITNIKSDT